MFHPMVSGGCPPSVALDEPGTPLQQQIQRSSSILSAAPVHVSGLLTDVPDSESPAMSPVLQEPTPGPHRDSAL